MTSSPSMWMNVGEVAKLLGAVFGAWAPDIPAIVGAGLAAADGGTSFADLAQLAIDARLGPHIDNGSLVLLSPRILR